MFNEAEIIKSLKELVSGEYYRLLSSRLAGIEMLSTPLLEKVQSQVMNIATSLDLLSVKIINKYNNKEKIMNDTLKLSNKGVSLDDYPEFNDHMKEQMVLIAGELNEMGKKYDTRLLAALMAGRAGLLQGWLISGDIITQEEARTVWAQAGVPIENPPEQKTEIVKIFDGEIITSKEIN